MIVIERGVPRQEFPFLLRGLGYETGVEIGVQNGHHAAHILDNWPGSLALVDAWKHQDPSFYLDGANLEDGAQEIVYRNCVALMARYGDRARIIRAFSKDAVSGFEDGSLDFVYLDANHSYGPVTEDLTLWTPKVRKGGMVSGHDFTVDAPPRTGNVFGVKPAVEDFFKQRSGRKKAALFVSQEEWPNWYFFV